MSLLSLRKIDEKFLISAKQLDSEKNIELDMEEM